MQAPIYAVGLLEAWMRASVIGSFLPREAFVCQQVVIQNPPPIDPSLNVVRP